MKIRITGTPPGFAPEEIRAQWVGVEIPIDGAAVNESLSMPGKWSGSENSDGYTVATEDAIAALKQAGKDEAAAFWQEVRNLGSVLRFKKDVCELLPS